MIKTLIVPVSGGKDSQVVVSLSLKEINPKRFVHQNTGYDHPLTYEHIKQMEQFYGINIEHTVCEEKDMFGFLRKHQYFPNSGARGCTQRLKQEPFKQWLLKNNFNKDNCEIWFGMRSDESRNRKDKYGHILSSDIFTLGEVGVYYSRGKTKHLAAIPVRLPIVDMTTEDVFNYLKEENAPLNPLYAKGHSRVGCYPCLLANKKEWQLAAKDEVGREHILKMIDIEKEFMENNNPRKYIKIHPRWDVRDFLENKDVEDLSQSECGWCSI